MAIKPDYEFRSAAPCDACGRPVSVPDDYPYDWALHPACKEPQLDQVNV